MGRKKVLMIGWEFPPVINGGLGVACLGLSKALANYADLSMILPKTDPGYVVDNVELLGANHIQTREILESTQINYEDIFEDVERVNISLSPYYTETQYETVQEPAGTRSHTTHSSEEVLGDKNNIFSHGELYGDDIFKKVHEFPRYAASIARNKEFDLIHAHDWMTFLAGVEIKKQSGKPLVLHVHALDYDRAGEHSRSWIYEIEKYGMTQADMIIPVSSYTGNILIHHYGADPQKIFPVYNGAEAVKPFRAQKKFPEKLVLFLGRITGQKGPEYFLDTAAKIYENYPNVRFVMAGTGDRLKKMIEAGAYRHISDRFHFTGFLTKDKVNQLLSMADVYCMPSVSEPFGLSALEAAQFDIPVVISNQSGVSEVMEGALKADYWDTKTMSNHIINLLQNRELRERVVNQSKKDLEKLTWDHNARQVAELYDKLIPENA